MRVPLRLQTPESLGRSGTRAAKLKAIRRVRGEEDADADASVEHEQGGDALEERLPPPSDNEDDKEWLPQQGQLPSDDEEEGDDDAASGEVGEAGAKVGKKRVRGSGRGGERAGRARLAAPDAEARGRGGRGRGGRGSPSSPIAAPPDPIYSSDTDPDEDDPEVAEVCASSIPPPPSTALLPFPVSLPSLQLFESAAREFADTKYHVAGEEELQDTDPASSFGVPGEALTEPG